MIPGSLAKRYARALFEIAATPVQRDRYLQTLVEFVGACKTRDVGGHDLLRVLASTQIDPAKRRAVLDAVLKKIGADATMVRFLQLVLARGRIVGIEQIYLVFRDLSDDAANRIRATVKTASRLEPGTDARIKAALERATGKTVLLTVEEDPELIGGLVAHIGSFTLDRSVRTSLDKLRLSLHA